MEELTPKQLKKLQVDSVLLELAQEFEVFAVPYRGKWIPCYWELEEVEQRLLEIGFEENELKDTMREALTFAVEEVQRRHYIDALDTYRG